MRKGVIARHTRETRIDITLGIEGKGRYEVQTGIRFFDHMLELFTRHGAFDLKLKANGDLDVDQHHTVEDVGIALGEAFTKALGTKAASTAPATSSCRWTRRWRSPRSTSSGRPHAVVELGVKVRLVGDLQVELLHDFFEGFAQGARANVHIKVMYGRSSHHRIEAVFKAFARAMRVACAKDKQLARMLPSTKGLL